MGQNLSNGVYLPDEGERNCYSGLAANWNILNTAVGNIAGKASSSHSHGNITNDGKVGTTANLPLITGTGGAVQVGSFGNQANTFCEGNDSRLSDARTPVAHTHGKSDITDLFNTDNTYGANQNFKNSGWEQGVTPANLTSLYLQFIDKNNSSFGAIGFHQDSNGYTFLNILAGDKYANGAKSTNGSLIRNQFRLGTTSAGITYQSFDGYWGSSLTPLTNNTYDLGTSTNKWKTLNGINPGALSLPNINYTKGDPDVYNVGTDINNLTKNVSDPLHFSWTAPVDGWLAIMWYLNGIQPPYNVLVTTEDARYSKFSQTWSASSTRWYLASTFPVVKNVTYYFEIDFQNTSIGVVHHAYLLPCLGNV